MRSDLLPSHLPGHLSRVERFDQAVLDSAQRLDDLWGEALGSLEFDVDDIPPDLESLQALGAPIPYGTCHRGATGSAVVIVYRRPIETAADVDAPLAEIVHDAIVEQAAELMGMLPENVDPHYQGFFR